MTELTLEDELALIKRKTKSPKQSPVDQPRSTPPQADPAPAEPSPEPTAPTSAFEEIEEVPLETSDLQNPRIDAGTWDVFGAAWVRDTITGDINNYNSRYRNNKALEMFRKLPPATQEAVAAPIWPDFQNPRQWETFEKRVMDAAALFVAENPEAWGDLPLTQEQFDAQILEEQKAELAEAEAILAQPGGGLAEFFGAAARDLTRPVNLALTPVGLGGTLTRFVVSETLLSAVSSVAALPGQYEAAERLDLPRPDAFRQVATETLIGAGFAGILGGGAKVLGWAFNRERASRVAKPEDINHLEFGAQVDAAEAALTGQRTVREETKGEPRAISLPPGDVPYNEAAVLRSIIGVESGGKADAQNPNSTARGLGQFISETWLNMISRYRPDLMEGRTANELLALRDDPSLNAEMTAMYTRENYAYLRDRGLPTNPGELYLAHFMGPGGAAKALSVTPDTPISSIMSPKAIAANAGIRFNGKSFRNFTTGDLRAWAQRKMRAAYDPNASADLPVFEATSRGYTGQGQVAVGDDMRINVDYEVVDYRSIIGARGDLQPRDRSRINSDEWVAATAARLDPAQLMPAPTANTGTPIIGPDNIIESGNGRAMAIARAYERHPDRAQAYKDAIEAAGYQIPDGVEQPVLVARRKTEFTPEQRRRAVVAAQDSGTARMNATETALAYRDILSPEVLGRLQSGADLDDVANADFARAATNLLPRSERNAMIDKEGGLNGSGVRSLKEIIFARAWSDPDIVALFTEITPKELRSLIDALEEAAPSWAALKSDIERGLVPVAMDISPFILDAVRLIALGRQMARREKMPVAQAMSELLNSPDLIEGALSPLTAALLRKMWRNGRAAPADEIAGFLTRYADEARNSGRAGGMFDAPTARDVLRTIDPDTFKDLPEDFGQARGAATPQPPLARLPEQGFDLGAQSPELETVHAEIEASLRGNNAPPAAPDARETATPDPAATTAAETTSAPVARSGEVEGESPGLATNEAPELADATARSFDARRAIAAGRAEGTDFEIEMGDGTTWSAEEILADLDRDARTDFQITFCTTNSGGPA